MQVQQDMKRVPERTLIFEMAFVFCLSANRITGLISAH